MADSILRPRHTAPPASNPLPSEPSRPSSSSQPSAPPYDDEDSVSTRISALDIIRILAGLLLLSGALSYFVTSDSLLWGYRPTLTRPARVLAWLRGPLVLSDAELSLYNGTDTTLPIYLGLNGSIYDVSASPHLYGPGGSYHFFAGRDATRAFVTGCFEEDLTGDLRGVEEMFVPIDDGVDDTDLGKKEKAERKVRREREGRLARKRVRETVEGWEKTFNGGKGGKYFRIGSVYRGAKWEGWGKRRVLCEKARKGRPKRGAENGM